MKKYLLIIILITLYSCSNKDPNKIRIQEKTPEPTEQTIVPEKKNPLHKFAGKYNVYDRFETLTTTDVEIDSSGIITNSKIYKTLQLSALDSVIFLCKNENNCDSFFYRINDNLIKIYTVKNGVKGFQKFTLKKK